MTLNKSNSMNENMGKVKSILEKLQLELKKNEEFYDNGKANASRGLIETQSYLNRKYKSEAENIVRKYNGKVEEIKNIEAAIRKLEDDFYNNDKSYYKCRISHEGLSGPELDEKLIKSDDFVSNISNIKEQLENAIYECSTAGFFSGKKKQLYETIYNLTHIGFKYKEFVDEAIKNKISDENERLYKEKQSLVDKKAKETNEKINEYNNKKINMKNRILENFNEKINEVLSLDDINILKSRQAELVNNMLPERCRQYISLGDLKIYLGDSISSKEVSTVIDRNFHGSIKGDSLVIPAIFDLREKSNFYFSSNSTIDKNPMHSIMYSLLRNNPASRQVFYMFDPVGRSKGFNIYLDFLKSHSEVMGGKVFTTKEQLKEQLTDLSNYIDEIGQTKFVRYKDIFEYNNEVIDKQESLKCLCILDFPKYFDEEMLEHLYNISSNGTAYGVNVLLSINNLELNDASNSLKAMINKIKECFINVTEKNHQWYFNNGVKFEFEANPTATDIMRFEKVFSEQYKKIKNAKLDIMQVNSKKDWFTGSSRDKISIPIGKNEDGNIQNIEFGDIVANGTSHYALIVGSTGSGKSTLIHTIIMNAITKYSPDEINLYLMDFKSGTEFKVYSERDIPHIKLIALDAMQEFGQSILDNLWSIIQERSNSFKSLAREGVNVKDIVEYRKFTGKVMPRILVIADEFQVLFSEDNNRKVANYCGGKMADFISLARVFGVHFIMATQTLSRLSNGFSIRKSTMNEMHVRIGLQCTSTESDLLFGDTNGKIAFNKMGVEKGSAVYIDNDVRGVPVGFKGAYCDNKTQQETLQYIEDFYKDNYKFEKARIFSGDSTPYINECTGFNEFDKDECFKSVPIYLGEPIKIAPPIRLNVNRMKRSNLLILGNNHEMSEKLTSLYMLNAIKSKPHLIPEVNDKSIYLFDGLTLMGETRSKNIDYVISSNENDIKIADDNFEILQLIDELYDIYLERRKIRNSASRNKGNKFSTIHIIINDFQWIEPINLMLLNKSVDEFKLEEEAEEVDNKGVFDFVSGGQSSNPLDLFDDLISTTSSKSNNKANLSYNKKIMALIEYGYQYGFNFVVSCQDLAYIKDLLYEVIPKFKNRIIFSLSNSDADRIIAEAKTEQLRSNMAIYSDGINESCQFKPYDGIRNIL